MLKIIFLGMFLMGTCGCAAPPLGWWNPNFGDAAVEIQNLYVNKPDIIINLTAFDGNNQLLVDMGQIVSRVVSDTIISQFEERGFTITNSKVSNEKFYKNPYLYLTAGELQDRYYAIVADANSRRITTSNESYNYLLGSNARRLSAATSSDAFILVCGRGFLKSKGEKSREVVRNAAVTVATIGLGTKQVHSSSGVLHMSLIDGKTGAVLWHSHSSSAQHHDLTDLAKVRELIQQMIRPFPYIKSR